MKALGGAVDDRILGFTIIGSEAGEVMAAVEMAMLAELPYQRLRDAVIAHLTIAEGLGSLFAYVPPGRSEKVSRDRGEPSPPRSRRRGRRIRPTPGGRNDGGGGASTDTGAGWSRPPANSTSAAMRSSIGGCVASQPLSGSSAGLSMKKACIREGMAGIVALAEILRSAESSRRDSWSVRPSRRRRDIRASATERSGSAPRRQSSAR